MAPPTPLANLQARYANICAELAAFPQKPSGSIASQSVQWTEYRNSLLTELADLTILINQLNPFELRTVAL